MDLPAPMFPSRRRIPLFAEPGWVYEPKLNGYRIIAGVDRGIVQLVTQRGADAATWFPEVVVVLASLSGGPHVLDGAMCVFDNLGRSNLRLLQDRARRRRWYDGAEPVEFCAFDLLVHDGRALLNQPLEERKRKLIEVLSPVQAAVRCIDHLDAEQGRALLERATELHLKGLVAKRLGSQYQAGLRSPDWRNVRRNDASRLESFKR